MTAARVPLNFFGMPFGLAGLGVTWLTMAHFGRVPQAVGDILLGPVQLDAFHPGYFLPTVARGLIASAGAADVGQRRLAEVMFGLGVICWLVLGSIILARLLFRPLPPDPLLPTLAIEVAPPAVASLAYFALYGDRVDTVAAFLGGYGLLMVLAQTYWLDDLRPAGYRVGEYLVLAVISALIGGIAIRTLLAIGRRQLMPRPVPARRDTELAGRSAS